VAGGLRQRYGLPEVLPSPDLFEMTSTPTEFPVPEMRLEVFTWAESIVDWNKLNDRVVNTVETCLIDLVNRVS
jgi:hypothetical protein